MIEDQEQLEYSIQALGRMYSIRDREAAETRWDPSLREDVLEGDMAMIRKIERQVAEYLAAKYRVSQVVQEKAA